MTPQIAPSTRTADAVAPSRNRWWIEGLDGLRALAIIGVLIFHLLPGKLRGGFIGVDVFFVLSGYLITTLLVREVSKNGKVNLPQFWVRRARRLLPALFTVVTLSTLLAFFAGGDLLVGIGRHVTGALTFSNNWLEILVGSDYFNASAPNLFMNFWSLAVEEQFYLLWPVLAIVIMATLRGRHRVWLMAAGAITSAIAMAIVLTPGDPTRVYYGSDTHAFGLLVGAGLAFAMAAPDIKLFDTPTWERSRVPLAVGGFAAVIILMMSVDGEGAFAYRGGLVMASLATAAMVASLPGNATTVTGVLKLRPLAWVGERSYGIYLWHWPMILIVGEWWPAATPDSPSWWVSKAVALTATLTVAAVSFNLIENPIRRHGFKASVQRIAHWWKKIPPRGRVLTGMVATTFTALFAIALLTAPAMSTLERSMLEAEQYVQEADEALMATAMKTPAASRKEVREQGEHESKPAQEESEPTPAESEPAQEKVPPAPEPEPAGLTPIEVDGTQVYGVGDSMMYVAAPGLADRIPDMVINAESNRQWPHIAQVVQAAVDAGEVGPVVVIAAGTNAGARDTDLIEATLDNLGSERRVVLVNIYSASSWVAESNTNLAQIAQDRANVSIADWHGQASAHPDQLQPDRIHPNMTGMHLFADTVAKACEELGVILAQ